MPEHRSFPKPTKKVKAKTSERLNHNHKTHSRSKVYRFVPKPTYLAGLAAGQGLRGTQPHCERCGQNKATQIHHPGGRSGPSLIKADNLSALCGDCHTWVHANPEAAYEAGWLKSRNALESDQSTE